MSEDVKTIAFEKYCAELRKLLKKFPKGKRNPLPSEVQILLGSLETALTNYDLSKLIQEEVNKDE